MAIMEVIKYEGDNTTFIWKHPKEDFNTNSKLIVHESQQAIFFRDGKILNVFDAGKYDLETDIIPLLRLLINIPTGGVSRIHVEIFFVNKTVQMAIPWGTDSKVQYMEPQFGFPLAIGAGGEMGLSVSDSRNLLLKLVGTESYLTRDRLVSYFKAMLMLRVKTYIAQIMRTNQLNIFEVDEHLVEFSDEIKGLLAPDFEEYGVTLNRFVVTRIIKPEGESQYEKFKELYFRQYSEIAEAKLRQQVGIIDQHTMDQRMIIHSQGLAQKRQIEGYTYQQERAFDISEKAAGNEGAGGFAGAGIGLGMMAGIGGAVGNTVGGMFSGAMAGINTQPEENVMFCEECGTKIAEGSEFCEECGHPVLKKVPTACSKCGYVFERPGKFCPKCGTKR